MKWEKEMMFDVVDVENVNGLLKCHYLMSHTDLFIDYWLLSFGSLTNVELCGAEILGKVSSRDLQGN